MKDNDKLHLDGYHWFGHNRSVQHIRAKRTFGGVGFFVKHDICQEYEIHEEFKTYDDMYGLLFTNKISGYNFIVFSVYLPPEGSTYCDSTNFFNRLLLEVYKQVDIDAIYFVGDINARIGGLNDITDLDNIAPRKHIENEYNSHGKSFIEFLHDAKCCIVNGRISSENDNFTSISTKGRSVVDYVFAPHDNIDSVFEFHVDTCADIVNILNLQYLINDNCKIPDHSLLSVKIHTSSFTVNLCRKTKA